MDFLTFFGLKEDPFKLTPDPAYFYPSSSHNEGMLLMDYSIDQKEGFLLIIGDPGTGKTTLLKVFMEKWKDKAEIAIVLTPRLSPQEFLLSVAEDFNISLENKNKNEIIKALRGFVLKQSAENKRVIIIVDEAQNMPAETLEELRLLSNLETDKDKLIQIMLLGQPELETKLQSDSLRQLNQRIVTRVHLQHFNIEETRDYINFRLIKAGKENLKVHSKAVKSVFRYTNGVPRLINMLISRSLMAAFLEESNTILHKHIQHAIKSLNHTDMKLKESSVITPIITGAAALLAISITAFLYISGTENTNINESIDKVQPPTEQTAAAVNIPDPASEHIISDTDEHPLPVQNTSVPDRQTIAVKIANTESSAPLQENHPEEADIEPADENKIYSYTTPYKMVSVNVDIAIIRDKPSANAPKVGWSQKGNQLIVLNESIGSDSIKWYLIPHQGGTHWISAEVVEEIQLNP